MKKLISVLFVLLLFSTIVSSSLKENIELTSFLLQKTDIYKEYVSKYSQALPISGKIYLTDKQESIYLYISKEGLISFEDKKKYDIIVEGTEADILALAKITDLNEIQDKSKTLTFGSQTFKGNAALIAAEKYLNVKLNRVESFSQSFKRFLVKPFVSLFV
ncbi:hypothetical protein J4405_04480 [Candidatus Woesearchaeota archaeon]|nr:hypothetical protein [Candidatus Woesearchaeota archaeon]